ncbi:MAG: hypothetical protein HPY89_08375 [Pelotomaculum sp.]|uniref:Serine protease inhibitor n=1 Tax=Pelotomaculum thermopropionicum (strain DSM 13744 / JCM 10971 / SI) TaxID=370438 RepID=A5D2G9_PELTS|nr:hypothetical protein [Pelotomaculum sp.]BAF59554.1 serine protease inhibitor [Pelotomaculum thermopropionicum SI]
MDKIKSAYEMALQRFNQRKEVPQSEIERMEYEPAGKALAARFLREKDFDLLAEIGKYPENVRQYVIEGAQETFLNNIYLPVDRLSLESSQKAMKGLSLLKKDRQSLEKAYSQLKYLFQYYEQALAQTYSQFKEGFAAKINATVKSLERRTGTKLKADPEKQPGFREEWSKVLSMLNSQYEVPLKEQKERLRNIK